MLDTSYFDTDLDNLIEELPTVITIDGKMYQAAKSESSITDASGELGIVQDWDVSVLVRRSRLDEYPLTGRKYVQMDGDGYRVVRSAISADGVQVQLWLKKETGRATA